MSDQTKLGAPAIASYVLAAGALALVLYKGLLAALLAGLLVYSLVHLVVPLLGKKISGRRAKLLAVAVLSCLIVLALTGAIWGAISFFSSDAGSIDTLLKKMADILEASRNQIPEWLR